MVLFSLSSGSRDQRDSRFSRILENFFSFSHLAPDLEPFQFHFHLSFFFFLEKKEWNLDGFHFLRGESEIEIAWDREQEVKMKTEFSRNLEKRESRWWLLYGRAQNCDTLLLKQHLVIVLLVEHIYTRHISLLGSGVKLWVVTSNKWLGWVSRQISRQSFCNFHYIFPAHTHLKNWNDKDPYFDFPTKFAWLLSQSTITVFPISFLCLSAANVL